MKVVPISAKKIQSPVGHSAVDMNNKYISTKYVNIDYERNIIDFFAQETLNQVDAAELGVYFTIDDKDGVLQNRLQKILDNSDFYTERLKASEALFKKGKVAISLITHNGKQKIVFGNVDHIEMEYGDIKKIVVSPIIDQLSWTKTSFEYEVLEDGRVSKKEMKSFVQVKGTEVVYLDFLPVWIIRDNPFNTTAIHHLSPWLKNIGQLYNSVTKEYEVSKTLFANSGRGSGDSGHQAAQDLLNGSSFIKTNGVIMEGMSPFSKASDGTQTPLILLQTISFLENQLFKLAFKKRDADTSSTNKTNSQISLTNRGEFEYNEARRLQRERDFRKFFNDVVLREFTGGNDRYGKVIVELQRTEFVKNALAIQERAVIENEKLVSETNVMGASAELSRAQSWEIFQRVEIDKQVSTQENIEVDKSE